MTNPGQFIFFIAILYLIYYSLNLLFDLFLSSGTYPKAEEKSLLINISELEAPIDASLQETTADYGALQENEGLMSSGPISSTGGMRLEEAMNGALQDAAVFSSRIPS
jgi:hypothetical protein